MAGGQLPSHRYSLASLIHSSADVARDLLHDLHWTGLGFGIRLFWRIFVVEQSCRNPQRFYLLFEHCHFLLFGSEYFIRIFHHSPDSGASQDGTAELAHPRTYRGGSGPSRFH